MKKGFGSSSRETTDHSQVFCGWVRRTVHPDSGSPREASVRAYEEQRKKARANQKRFG